jgi:hypothetical protein
LEYRGIRYEVSERRKPREWNVCIYPDGYGAQVKIAHGARFWAERTAQMMIDAWINLRDRQTALSE